MYQLIHRTNALRTVAVIGATFCGWCGCSSSNDVGRDRDLGEEDSSPFEETLFSETFTNPLSFSMAPCGSIATKEIAFSKKKESPVPFAVGEVVGGRIDLKKDSVQEHFWTIDIVPGSYHVVVDAATLSGEAGNIELDIESFDEASGEYLPFQSIFDAEQRSRSYAEVSFTEARKLQLRAKTGFSDSLEYEMVFLPVDRKVPSPFLARCPDFESLKLSTEKSFELGGDEGSPSKWFSLELDRGEYILEKTVAREPGATGDFGYRLHEYHGLGDGDVSEMIWVTLDENTLGSFTTLLTVKESQTVWLRADAEGEGRMLIDLKVRKKNSS